MVPATASARFTCPSTTFDQVGDVERVDDHLPVDGPRDLDLALAQVGRGGRDAPVALRGLLEEARQLARVERLLAPEPLAEEAPALAVEARVERGDELKRLGREDLARATFERAEDRDSGGHGHAASITRRDWRFDWRNGEHVSPEGPMADGDSENELLAQELENVGGRVLALEARVMEVEAVIKGLEEAALTTARALEEVSAHWDAVYRAMRRAE